MCSDTCEVIWLRNIPEYIEERKGSPTSIKCDNQSSIKLENNPIYHASSKQIETQYHFLWEKVQSIEIYMLYYNTNENVVDIFTKPLGKSRFVICRDKLGIVENSFLH